MRIADITGHPFKISIVSILLFFSLFFPGIISHPPLAAVQGLLFPTAWIAGAALQTPFTWIPGSGFYNSSHNLLINQSCSGLPFFVVLILLNTVLYTPGCRLQAKTTGRYLLLTLFSFCFTVIANAARIVSAVYIEGFKAAVPWLDESSSVVHQACGIIVFFAFLVFYHFIITRGNLWKQKNV